MLITLGSAVAKIRPITPNPFNLSSAFFGGTINRYTDPNPIPLEFDILVKVENRPPPFSEVLDFIDTTIRNNAFRLQISPRTIKVTAYSVCWVFTNGISVTLIPAVSDLSRDEVFKVIKGINPKIRRYYSSSLVEKRIDFIKQQSFYAHKVGRLAKFWYQSMDLKGCYINQAAVIFDLLACAAVLEEEDKGHGREAILRAFTRVVELIEGMDKMGLAFEREYGQYGQWKVRSYNIPDLLPRLTEPNAPKWNILHGIDTEVVDIFKRNGKAMRERIRKLMDKQEYCLVIPGENSGTGQGEGTFEEAMAQRPRLVIQFEKLFGLEEQDALNNNSGMRKRTNADDILDED